MVGNISWVWLVNAIVVAALLFASWRWGAAPERASAGAILFLLLADRLYHLIAGRGSFYLTLDVGHLVIDAAAAMIFLTIALWANRIYPLWLAALQSLSVIAHFTREASETVGRDAYAILTNAPSVLLIVVLSGGIALHSRRVRRYGSYPSWRSSSNLSPGAMHGP